jgi:hypothetical protein
VSSREGKSARLPGQALGRRAFERKRKIYITDFVALLKN